MISIKIKNKKFKFLINERKYISLINLKLIGLLIQKKKIIKIIKLNIIKILFNELFININREFELIYKNPLIKNINKELNLWKKLIKINIFIVNNLLKLNIIIERFI